MKHFGVRITPNGVKSYVVLLGSGRRQVIGHFPVITLAEARDKARRILAERTLGRHQATSITWQAATEKFIAACEAKNRTRTHREYARALKRHFSFGTTRLTDITRQEIGRKLEKLVHIPSQQAHSLVICKIFFRWALVHGHIDIDPSAGFKRARQRKSTRILTEDELKKVWQAATDQAYPHGTLVQLLILTGQRRGEIANLRRSWINKNDRVIVLPEWLTKNGKEHRFPYSDMVADILATLPDTNGLFFPCCRSDDRAISGFSKYKKQMTDGAAGWTLHSLRRLYRTTHAKIGTRREIAERLINHVSAVASDVEQIYDVYDYLPEMRKAVEQFERHVASVLASQLAQAA